MKPYYYNAFEKGADFEMNRELCCILQQKKVPSGNTVILCIGTDRATGDCLGPLVGDYLKKAIPDLAVYGTLEHPVHALNLEQTIQEIYTIYEQPFIIAIDASLGKEDHIGMMTLGSGPLKPGLGVKKKLPEVGDLHITGIVNSSHDMESSTLQTTRLSIIFQIADAIVLALRTFNDDYYIQQEPELSYLLSQTS
mgnify:CR=1 FL=1